MWSSGSATRTLMRMRRKRCCPPSKAFLHHSLTALLLCCTRTLNKLKCFALPQIKIKISVLSKKIRRQKRALSLRATWISLTPQYENVYNLCCNSSIYRRVNVGVTTCTSQPLFAVLGVILQNVTVLYRYCRVPIPLHLPRL